MITSDGERIPADVVVLNPDLPVAYRDLLGLVRQEYEDIVKNEVQRAIAADPGYAPAQAGLAKGHLEIVGDHVPVYVLASEAVVLFVYGGYGFVCSADTGAYAVDEGAVVEEDRLGSVPDGTPCSPCGGTAGGDGVVSRFAAKTRPADVADLTISVLRGDHGPQRVELDPVEGLREADQRLAARSACLPTPGPPARKRLTAVAAEAQQTRQLFPMPLLPEPLQEELPLLLLCGQVFS